jgi:serine/threonine protein kinase
MGAVYLALDEALDRKIALKVMLPSSAANDRARERFLREARAAAAVRHVNVVTVYQVGEDCGVPFIAMEFLSGSPLDIYLERKGQLNISQVLRVGRETATGLAAAHALGVIHRDIKPANLWLEAPNGHVKILDFGIAQRAGDPDADPLAGSRSPLGTPAFMSPEQARGKTIDHRSDLFSLGVVLYHLTTGRRPFEGDTTLAVLTSLIADEPQPVRSLNPDVPERLADLIHRLLAKNPDDRAASATEVGDELKRVASSRKLRAQETGRLVPPPQVVYIPVAVEPSESSAFDGLADEPAQPAPVTPTKSRSNSRSRSSAQYRGPLIAVGTTLLLAVAFIAGVSAFTGRNPRPVRDTQLAPPDTKDIKDTKPARPAPKLPPGERQYPDKRLAEWVTTRGGSVVTTDGSTITAITDLPGRRFRLQTITVTGGPPVTNNDLELFRGIEDLKGIHLGSTDLDDAGFGKLATLIDAANVTELSFASPSLTDVGIAHIARFRNLTYLSLYVNVTDDALEALADLSQLKHLGLAGNSKLTDKAASRLVELSSVTSLDLGNTGFGDDGLKALAALSGLTNLDIQGTPTTDKGLTYLADRKLSVVNVRSTQVTAAGVKDFRAANPNCMVQSDFEKP